MHCMRAVGVGLAALALVASGGCFETKGAVLLRFTPDAPIVIEHGSYSSTEAAVVFDPDGPVHFAATSNQGTLRLELVGPLQDGAVVDLPPRVFQLDLGAFAFDNQGGKLVVTSANPAIVTLVSVPMVTRDSGDAGAVSFVVDGAGTFR